MIQKTNQPLYFYAQFTANQQGKPVSATVDVYDNTNTKIVDNAPATALAFGLVRYTVANPTTGGAWAAIFKTTDPTVDLQHLPALQLVGVAGVDNLDAAVGSRLATSGYTAPDNAGITGLAGAVAAAYAAAVAAKDSADGAKSSADAAARPGNAMALLSGTQTTLAQALSDRLERAGGPLDIAAAVAGKLATMLVSAGAGLLSRFTPGALQNAPSGGGVQTLRGPFGLETGVAGDTSEACFVGDTSALLLYLKDGNGQPVSIPSGAEVTAAVSAFGQITTAAGACPVVFAAGGAVSYTLAPADTASPGQKQVTVTLTSLGKAQTFGPLLLTVKRK